MTPEEYATKVAIEINRMYRQKGEGGAGFSAGKGMTFAAPMEIPPDIKKVHALLQKTLGTLYLKNQKLEFQEKDVALLAKEISALLENSKPKSSTMGGGLSVAGTQQKDFDEAYNKILKLRDAFKATPLAASPIEPKPTSRG